MAARRASMGRVTSYGGWPAPVRAMATAIDDAVQAATAGDADGFEAALATLSRVDREPLAVVLGGVARELLERGYPDGMDAGDAEQLLARIPARFAWYPGFQPEALLQALTGTLGVSVAEDEAPLPAAVPHGLLLVADLLGTDPPAPALESALCELRRQQTVELP